MPQRRASSSDDEVPDLTSNDEWDIDRLASSEDPGTTRSSTHMAVPVASVSATGRRHWGRSPWALPVMVAVLVVLLGGASLRAARSAATTDLQLAEQLASIRVGTTQVLSGPGDLRHDAQGRLLVPLQAEVRNDGDAPVTVTVLATSTEHAALASAQALRALKTGASGQLQWTLAVDCAAVPSAADSIAALNQALRTSTASPTQWLDLQVFTGHQTSDETPQRGEPEDRGQRQRYFTADAPGSDVAYLLPSACDPAAVSGG